MKSRDTSPLSFHKSSKQWHQAGEAFALAQFHTAAKRVPAYKQFLKKQKINPHRIKTITDFEQVPFIDKKNYIDVYPLSERIINGAFKNSLVINASSGTTGTPYFWPYGKDNFQDGAAIHEVILRDMFAIKKYTTLLIITFGMGTWVAGIYTFLSSFFVGQKGYPLSIISPGLNKEETIRILDTIAPLFEQTIIAGYPTFVKDILELWRPHPAITRLKFLFAGEGYSETWREYVLKLIKVKETQMINILGSADAAIMGFETPKSIALRKLATHNSSAGSELFHSYRIPSIENYIPTHRYFESEKGELVLTASSVTPLIRYNIHDNGGVYTSDEIEAICKEKRYILRYDKKNDYALPFVYVFGRGRFTATIYAGNIYPENVKEALLDKAIRKYVSGRFQLTTEFTKKQDHYLHLKIELAKTIDPSHELALRIANTFVKTVKRINSEYNRIYQEYGEKVKPVVALYRYEDPTMFPSDKIRKTS